MGSENGRAELRGLYTDPAQPLTVAVGQVFDLVSMPAAVGHAALTALRVRRVRLGPVVADSRRSVMRVGFLVAPGAAGTEAEGGGGGGGAGVGAGAGAGSAARSAGAGGGIGGVRGRSGLSDLGAVDVPGRIGVSGRIARAGAADPDSAALSEWASRSGGTLGVRVGGRGSTATLPPLLPSRGWLHWLVPPGAATDRWTPSGELLTVLAERTGARAL